MPTYNITAPDGRKLRITGDTPPDKQQLDKIFSQIPSNEKSLASKASTGIGNLLGLRNLQSTINLGVATPGFSAQQKATQNLQTAQEEAQRQILGQARQTTDEAEKQRLLSQSRGISQEMGTQGDLLAQQGEQLQSLGRISDKDLEQGSNLGFATRRGVGSGLELGALLAPQTQVAGRATIGSAALSGGVDSAVRSALTAGIDPSNDSLEDIVEKTTKAGITSFLVGGALSGGTKAVGQFLEGVGNRIKPKERLRIAEDLDNSIQSRPRGDSAGERAILSQFRIPRTRGAQLKPQETVRQLLDDGVDFSGGLDDVYAQTQNVTGANGALSQVTRRSISNAKGKVSLDNAQKVLSSELDNAVLINDSASQKIKNQINNILTKNQSNINQLDPIDAFDNVREIEQMAAYYNGLNARSTVKNPEIDALARVYKSVADTVKDDLYKTVGKSQIDDAFSDDVVALLQDVSPKLTSKALKAESVADLRALQAPYVRMAQMIDDTRASEFSTFNQFTDQLQNLNIGQLLNPIRVGSELAGGPERANLTIGQTLARSNLQPRQSVGSALETAGQNIQGNQKLEALRRLLAQISGQAVSETGEQDPKRTK